MNITVDKNKLNNIDDKKINQTTFRLNSIVQLSGKKKWILNAKILFWRAIAFENNFGWEICNIYRKKKHQWTDENTIVVGRKKKRIKNRVKMFLNDKKKKNLQYNS